MDFGGYTALAFGDPRGNFSFLMFTWCRCRAILVEFIHSILFTAVNKVECVDSTSVALQVQPLLHATIFGSATILQLNFSGGRCAISRFKFVDCS